MKRILSIVVAFVLTACGGGGGDAPVAPVKPVETPKPVATKLLFWGNSLTYYPTSATYNGDISAWGQGGWGMAASAPDKDYVHITAAALGLPFTALNLADNERDPNAPLPDSVIDAGTIVVIQLGDNGLPAKYADMVARARAGFRLVCFSAWGPTQRPRDAIMKPQCEGAGGTWIDISDLYANGANVGLFAHPNDAGEAEMARRLLAVLKG